MINSKPVIVILFCIVVFSYTACEIISPVDEIYISGHITNRFDDSPVNDVKVIVKNVGWTSGSTVASSTPDNQGFYDFNIYPENIDGAIRLDLDDQYKDKYQIEVWVNKGQADNFPILGQSVSRYESEQNYDLALYPRTYFNVNFINKEQSAGSYSLDVTLFNQLKKNQNLYEGPVNYTFSGSYNTIAGECRTGNMLTIQYTLIFNNSNKEFEETYECVPGGLTEINIEF